MEANKNTIYFPAMVRGSEFTEDQNEFDFIITTDKVDKHRTIFRADGWDFSEYKSNPVVFYNHRSGSDDPDDLIGITIDGPKKEQLKDGSTGYVATVRLEPKDVNSKAEKVRKKIINGSLRMASIGATVHDYEFIDDPENEDRSILVFTKQRLFEWSIVGVGSNPGALKKNNENTISAIRSAYEAENDKGIPDPESDAVKNGHQIERARLEVQKLKSNSK